MPPCKEGVMIYKCPVVLHTAITKAKTQEELKPLLQAYYEIYGTIPDVLCHMYEILPKNPETK